jgi:hypothetical protein
MFETDRESFSPAIYFRPLGQWSCAYIQFPLIWGLVVKNNTVAALRNNAVTKGLVKWNKSQSIIFLNRPATFYFYIKGTIFMTQRCDGKYHATLLTNQLSGWINLNTLEVPVIKQVPKPCICRYIQVYHQKNSLKSQI